MDFPIDPDSPIPLYHQIAEAIRTAIQAGRLAPGDALEPMRRAAEIWGVNMHTVRHAYAALARDGLIRRNRGPRGTRVVGRDSPDRQESAPGVESFLERIKAEAARRYGLGPADLLAALGTRVARADAEGPVVYVVECSTWQCASHAREIESRFQVEARPWPLFRSGEPPAGPILSTYFHYNDIRRRWPRRLPRIHFLTIYPDPEIRERLRGRRRIVVCELDAATTDAVAADLSALLPEGGTKVEPMVVETPSQISLRSKNGPPILFAPRVWAKLPEKMRRHPRAIEIRYVLDGSELTQLAGKLQWRSKQEGAAA